MAEKGDGDRVVREAEKRRWEVGREWVEGDGKVSGGENVGGEGG